MDVGYMLGGMLWFAAQYCLAKCVRTMFVGMMVLPFIFLVRACNRKRRADVNFYAMLFLIPAAFTGMSKIFFTRYAAMVTVFTYSLVKPPYGVIFGLFYFGVMTVLLARFLRRNRRLKRRVKSLPVWEEREAFETAVARVAGRDTFGFAKKYLNRVTVYVTKDRISPFSGGLLHPYVVLPERILTEWSPEELGAALCHEFLHLKSGHILWLVLFRLLKIYWWGNPVIYFCEKLLREDMELMCDEQCIRYAGVSCATYGRALLDMIALMQGAGMEGTLCFSGRNDYLIMKKRIGNLAVPDGAGEAFVRDGKRRAVFAALFAASFVLIALTSYPKYTKLDDIVLYDEELNILDFDSEKLRMAVSVADGRLVIDGDKFGALLKEKEVKGEYVYLSFDAIMKIPGSGGCGNSGMVSTGDFSDIIYLASDGLDYKIEVFWLKYLI